MVSPAGSAGKSESARRLIDEGFRNKWANYVVQCLLAVCCVMLVLMALDFISRGITVASLGASSFIAFAMPHQRSSTARVMIGGYVIGITAGAVCYALANLPIVSVAPYLTDFGHQVFGAIAVGIAIFAMVITQTEHPPAAGLALGLVIDGTDNRTVLIAGAGVCAIYGLKALLKPALIDLT